MTTVAYNVKCTVQSAAPGSFVLQFCLRCYNLRTLRISAYQEKVMRGLKLLLGFIRTNFIQPKYAIIYIN